MKTIEKKLFEVHCEQGAGSFYVAADNVEAVTAAYPTADQIKLINKWCKILINED